MGTISIAFVLGCSSGEVTVPSDEEQRRQAEERFQQLPPEEQERIRQMQEQQSQYFDRFFNPPSLSSQEGSE